MCARHAHFRHWPQSERTRLERPRREDVVDFGDVRAVVCLVAERFARAGDYYYYYYGGSNRARATLACSLADLMVHHSALRAPADGRHDDALEVNLVGPLASEEGRGWVPVVIPARTLTHSPVHSLGLRDE